MSERPTVEIVVRRNRNGSVLAFEDRDRAARLLEDHRGVLSALYDLVDRRHGSDGETVAEIVVRDDERTVDDLDVAERFRRDLEADRAISIAEDLRDAAGERQLVTDGGRDQSGDERDDDLERIADALELQNALLLQLLQDRERERAREHPDPEHSRRSDHATATDVVDSYGDLYGGSIGWEFDPVADQVENMGGDR